MSVFNLLIPSIGSGGSWSDEYFAVSWGIYIGEFFLVAIWIAWGSGNIYQRVGGGLVTGATWITFSWLGSIGYSGTVAFAYNDEMLRVLYVPFIALLAITGTMLIFRLVGNWQLYSLMTRPIRSRQFTLGQYWQ